MTVPPWLHAAAWWCVLSAAFSVWWLERKSGASLFARGWARGTLYGYATVALALLLVSGCPPARATELRWTAPVTLEGGRPAHSEQVHRVYYVPRLPRGGNPSLFTPWEWADATNPWCVGEVDSVRPGTPVRYNLADWWMQSGTVYVAASNAAGESAGSNGLDVGHAPPPARSSWWWGP